jgi:asparagine synthetase B (glutamine-hydrolysing)
MHSIDTLRSKYPTCSVLLSGGIDTSAVVAANNLLQDRGILIEHAVTVLTSDRSALDRPYASLVAEKYGFDHHIVDAPLETFLSTANVCIKALKTFDGMTLRNSLVIAAVR